MAYVIVNDREVRLAFSVGGVSTTDFDFEFTYYASSDIKVYNGSTLLPSTDYTITGNTGTDGGFQGGTVVLNTGVTNTTITLVLDLSIQRTANFPVSADFDITRLNQELNRIVSMQQQLASSIDRCLKLAVTTTFSNDLVIPDPSSGSPLIGYNPAGNALQLYSLSDFPVDADIVTAGLANNDFLLYNSATGQFENKSVSVVEDLLGTGGAMGTNIPSASTTNLGAADSNFVTVTGTTTITSLGTSTDQNHVWVKFAGALTLTHNATSLILPTAANITTAAGDIAEFARISGGNWQCLNYFRTSGLPLAIKDEDNMASDSAVHVPTQQSVKAYVDAEIAALELGGWKQIVSKTASADSTLDFVNGSGGVVFDATYTEYEWVFNFTTSADGVALRGEITDDGGVSWENTNYSLNRYGVDNNSDTIQIQTETGNSSMEVSSNVGNAAGENCQGTIRTMNPASTSAPKAFSINATNTSSGGILLSRVGHVYHNATTAINGFRFSASSGTITGVATLWAR